MKREELLKKVRFELKQSYGREDYLQHASVALGELDNMLNIMFEHLKNWYLMYFPNLRVNDRKVFIEIAMHYDRNDKKSLEKLSKKARKAVEEAEDNTGSNADSRDLNMLRKFAEQTYNMYTLRSEMEIYRENTVKEIAKNLTYLIGAPLATELIVEAKGLKRLANMPASSIQVLGAEKALFMHLTRHTKPPKHGIIFLHPAMRGIKKSKRGKIARLIAAKIAIAAKADEYTKKFIAPDLKRDLDKKITEVKSR